MTRTPPTVDLGTLGLDGGGHVLVKLALAEVDAVGAQGTHPELAHHLATWCRQQGHRWRTGSPALAGVVERGPAAGARWVGATRAEAVVAAPRVDWGLSARGAAVEPGGPAPSFRLNERDEVWTERASSLYAQAIAAQWNPDTAIDWSAPIDHGDAVESAVVQVMTFLIENEEARSWCRRGFSVRSIRTSAR